MSDFDIVLLSSINVGRSNRIGNPELKNALERLEFPDARAVMQSGNLIIENASAKSNHELEDVLEYGLKETLELETHAFASRASTLKQRVSNPPWTAQPNRIHLFVHKTPITGEALDKLHRALKDTEEISLDNHHFWLHAPDGLARSKIAARASSIIGQPVTARSLSSLGKILAAAAPP